MPSTTMSATCSGSSAPAEEMLLRALRLGEHVGLHALWTQCGYPDAAVAISDRKPFRKRERGVLRDRVRRRADFGQQARGGYGLKQITLLAREHPRQHSASGEDMRLYVDFPDALPIPVRHVASARNTDAGVRAEQIDAAMLHDDSVDHRLDF